MNFYDYILKVCDRIFVTNRKDKKLIIPLLYEELTSATGMKCDRTENSETDSSKYENLVHDKDDIFKICGIKIEFSICIGTVGQAFGTQTKALLHCLNQNKFKWIKYLD